MGVAMLAGQMLDRGGRNAEGMAAARARAAQSRMKMFCCSETSGSAMEFKIGVLSTGLSKKRLPPVKHSEGRPNIKIIGHIFVRIVTALTVHEINYTPRLRGPDGRGDV